MFETVFRRLIVPRFFPQFYCRESTRYRRFMELSDVVTRLKKFAPLSLAEDWDNVGLLVEPSGRHEVSSILLTNDLTECVMEEACVKKVNMILSYHPPIFTPLKRLTSQNMKERIIIKAIEERIAIYSPHTAFDAVQGGVNDWLASGLGKGDVTPLSYSLTNSPCGEYKVKVKVRKENLSTLVDTLLSIKGVMVTDPSLYSTGSVNSQPVAELVAYCSGLESLTECLSKTTGETAACLCHPEVTRLEKHPIPGSGPGRYVSLTSPVSLEEMIRRIKQHLNLEYLRVACCTPPNNSIRTVGLCAGSGSSVLRGVRADLYLTGEMSHHDVIHATSQGTNVILCEHSNSERGFLTEFSKTLTGLLERKVTVNISDTDKDPLSVV